MDVKVAVLHKYAHQQVFAGLALPRVAHLPAPGGLILRRDYGHVSGLAVFGQLADAVVGRVGLVELDYFDVLVHGMFGSVMRRQR